MSEYGEIRNYVSNVIRKKIDSFADREDLFSEIMLALSQRRFRGESDEKTYAYSIAKRRIADFYRKQYRKLLFDANYKWTLSFFADPVSHSEAINRALQKLSEIERLILVMQYFADMEISEIAEALKYRIVRVRRIRKKALPKLRVHLEKLGYGIY